VKGLTSRNRISEFLSKPEVDRYKTLTSSTGGSTETGVSQSSAPEIVKKPLSRAQNALACVENASVNAQKREIESKIAFEVKDAIFSWPASSRVLSGINLKVETGSLTIISGPTGSGKTSLILSLIDEMKIESGAVDWCLDPRIALVTQKPW